MNYLKVSFALVCLFLLLVFNPENSFAQPTPFRIVGYVPSYKDAGAFAQNFDFSQVTHLNFAFQNPDASGNLVASNAGLEALVTKAHASKVKVLVSIGGGGAATGTAKDNFVNLITTAQKRADFIHKIVDYLKKYKLDGLDVDIEGPAINADYGAFISQLADSIKPRGFLLTAAVGWGSEKIQNHTLPLFDYITLMAYDYTGNWDLTRPGQHSPYWFAQKMITDWLARGVKKENLCLGLPFYGYGFYKRPGSYSYNKILEMNPEASKFDQISDTIYYNGPNTIRKKTKLAMEKTSGVMIWELTQDAPGNNSLLKVINQAVDSLTLINQISPIEAADFKLYPNPAQNQLIIEGIVSDSPVKIEVFNLNGKLIKLQEYRQSDGKMRLRIGSFASGKYICRVKTSEGNYSKMFVKEK
jgi:GH18 family chitinase